MQLFWIFAAVLVVTTVGVLLWPLLRRAPAGGVVNAGPDADSAAVAVYRDQKRALDAELASGTVTPEEYEASLAELAGRVADEVKESTPASATASPFAAPRALAIAVALLVIVPAAAFLLYQRLGDPGASIVAASDPNQELGKPQIDAMIGSLKRRLQQHPNDAESWVLLGRAYEALERFSESADAYAHADALTPNNPDILADYADALAMTQGRKLAGKPAALVARALEIDPKNKRALAMAATIALEAHDLNGSLTLWRRLAAELPPGSEDLSEITAVISQLEGAHNAGKGGATSTAALAKQATTTASPASTSTSSAGSIKGRVVVSPQFASKIGPADTVFIFARAVEGPRMPLAILRISAKELPKDFTLDDSLGMAGGAKLSSVASVMIEARVSKSGNAMPQSGDLFGRSAPVKPGASGINITIDQVVP